MYKAMDTAVTVCHFILVATARVSTKNLGHYSLNNTCVPGRESGKRFSKFIQIQYFRIYKKHPKQSVTRVSFNFYKKDDTFEIKFTGHVSVAQRPSSVESRINLKLHLNL